MLRLWKRMKPWARWTIGLLGSFLILVLCVALFLYYQIKSIDLEDIQERIQARETGGSAPVENKELPSILENSLEKANSMASKSVKTQDALDVAAILLNSGLSLKEVYYLIGQSTDKLSNEEKQKIRDLLLSKLTKEEILALRSITTEYGKGLVILDPNYPIELVGVYDETERARIQGELEKKKQSAEAKQAAASPLPTSQLTTPITSARSETVQTSQSVPSTNAASVPAPSIPTAKGVELQASYKAKLNTIQASCSAKVDTLSKELLAKLKSTSSESAATLQELQATFLPEVIKAEKECDNAFNQAMSDATSEYTNSGLGLEDINSWRQAYTNFKQQARVKAIEELSSAIGK